MPSGFPINTTTNSMEYTKITCFPDPDNELARELLIAELGNSGFESFVETEEAVEAFIPTRDFSPEILNTVELQQNTFFRFSYQTEVIADQNWNEVWEQNYFEPLLVEGQCMIRAPFHESYPSAPYEIIINPRMAFGTGNHETTHLMITAMLETEFRNEAVLDMGCGSGILSILASMLGAAEILAIDIDEWSFNNSIENAALNHIENITVQLGDASLLRDQEFSVILANIQRNILIQDMDYYVKVLKPAGQLIMSGFYTSDLAAVTEKAASLGLSPGKVYERSGWCAASFSK